MWVGGGWEREGGEQCGWKEGGRGRSVSSVGGRSVSSVGGIECGV